jgi:predicted nucleic acid-binding protein
MSEALIRHAWSTANDLGQSDVFDSLGYAVALARDGEFWTSDQRFANAAANRGLPNVVFVP